MTNSNLQTLEIIKYTKWNVGPETMSSHRIVNSIEKKMRKIIMKRGLI